MSNNKTSNVHSLLGILLAIIGIIVVSHGQDAEIAYKRASLFVQYIAYLLTAGGVLKACMILYNACLSKKLKDLERLAEEHKVQLAVTLLAIGILLMQYRRQAEMSDDFLFFLAAFSVWKCMQKLFDKEPEPTINYGTGMACNFFEAYLKTIIPSDGKDDNFVDKIRKFEDSQGIKFPVKKLLLIVPYKTLYCPADLKFYNKPDRHDLLQIEACRPIEPVIKNVGGVIDRKYQNSAYLLRTMDGSRPPIYIMTEFATPLNTLYGIKVNQELYPELSNVDGQKLALDFCVQLKKILKRSPDCREVELVYFDEPPEHSVYDLCWRHAESKDYLPELLFRKVEELEPNYLDIIKRHAILVGNMEEFSFPQPERILTAPNLNLL